MGLRLKLAVLKRRDCAVFISLASCHRGMGDYSENFAEIFPFILV